MSANLPTSSPPGASIAAQFLARLEAQRRTLKEEVEGDVAPLRGLSLEQRALVLESVCRDAMAILRARPDAERALQQQDPSPAWRAIVERYRGRH